MYFRDRVNKLFRVDVDGVQAHGKTRLQDAIDSGVLARVQSLIESGASPDEAGHLVHPPLHQAILREEAKIAQFLIAQAKADVNKQDAKGDSALKLAVIKGDSVIVKEILDKKGDPNIADSDGRTPVFYVTKSNLPLLGLLVEHGANVNAYDSDGNTPLHVHASQPDIVKALLVHGANPAILNSQKKSAAHLVLEHNPSNGEIVTALSHSTGSLSTVNQDGKNCLHFLVCGDNPRAVEFVLAKNPDLIDSADYKNRTPMAALLEEMWNGHIPKERLEIISILLKAGADPNTRRKEGETLLHLAASGNNNVGIITELVKHKADLNAVTPAGKTAVHIAAEKKLLDVLDVLLDLGANPNIKDERGWTLLDQMAKGGDRDSTIVQRLIAGGGQYNKMLPKHPEHMRHQQPQPPMIDRKKAHFDRFGNSGKPSGPPSGL